jgi:hypothetical protein
MRATVVLPHFQYANYFYSRMHSLIVTNSFLMCWACSYTTHEAGLVGRASPWIIRATVVLPHFQHANYFYSRMHSLTVTSPSLMCWACSYTTCEAGLVGHASPRISTTCW